MIPTRPCRARHPPAHRRGHPRGRPPAPLRPLRRQRRCPTPTANGAVSGGGRLPNGQLYPPDYDRTLTGPDPWDTGPGDGGIFIVDVALIRAQYGHSCTAPPPPAGAGAQAGAGGALGGGPTLGIHPGRGGGGPP